MLCVRWSVAGPWGRSYPRSRRLAFSCRSNLRITRSQQRVHFLVWFSTSEMSRDRKVIVLTPPGRSAIATVRIEGVDALLDVCRYLSTRKGNPVNITPAARPILARLKLPLGGSEEVVLHAASGECVEIHCHGSPLLVEQIVDLFVQMGYARESVEAWIDRTESDIIAAEARRSLCEVLTFRGVQILIDQYRGALKGRVEVVQHLIQTKNMEGTIELLDELLRWGELGLHLVKPWKVALVGPANVGKSSLLNRLVGYDRAIVDATPGTTRDFVTAVTAIDGWPSELCDTAGLRQPQDPIEEEGVRRTLAVADAADLVVLVFSCADPWSKDYDSWRERWPRSLVVYNKCDLPAAQGDRPAGLEVSAVSGHGLAELEQEVVNRLVPVVPSPGTAVPFTDRQIRLLRQTRDAVLRGDYSEAEKHISTLLGH